MRGRDEIRPHKNECSIRLRRARLLLRRLAFLVAPTVIAGADSAGAQAPPSSLPEARIDVIAGRATIIQLGSALSIGGAGYGRGVLAVGSGPAWQGHDERPSARLDALGRFHLDPYRTTPWGLYAAGGVSGLYDGFDHWRVFVTTALGLEVPSRAGGAWAMELGLGGGLRIAVALRKARRDRR